MNERNAIFGLIADIRGRLDELEMMARALPNSPIPMPNFFDAPGVVSLTPPEVAQFREQGMVDVEAVLSGGRCPSFFGVSGPSADLAFEVESFELSDIHKATPEPRYGIAVRPQFGQQPWMVYSFILGSDLLLAYEWTEWVLKLSAPSRANLEVFFDIFVDGTSRRIVTGQFAVSEFASFIHVRLSRGEILEQFPEGRSASVHLCLGTGGAPVPLRVYDFSVFGKPV